MATLARLDVRYTMAIRTGNKAVARPIAGIDEDAWADIDYTPGGQAQVAETTYKGRRLIVRRTRLTDRAQRRLWPDWCHHAFLTDLDGAAADVDAFHRRHAEVELAIRDRERANRRTSARISALRDEAGSVTTAPQASLTLRIHHRD